MRSGTEVMEPEASNQDLGAIAAEAERLRERERVRRRERRQSMTTEERENYLARRRQNYQIQRARILNAETLGNEGPSQTLPTNSGSATTIGTRAIPITTTTSVGSIHANQVQASASHAPTSRNRGMANTNRGTRRLARSIPIPISVGSGQANQVQASNFHATTSTNQDSANCIGGTSRFARTIPIPTSVGSVQANQVQASRDPESEMGYDSHANDGYNCDHDHTMHERADTSGRVNHYYNCARDFHEGRHRNRRWQLPRPSICQYCQAKRFHGETPNFCCKRGRVVLPEIPVPVELHNLFTDQSVEGRIFRQNICAFNHVFSFTSMGVKLDENLATGRQGVYVFRAHGTIYHRIGTLLPLPGTRPRFIQLFIYDTEHETENRLLENEGLNTALVEKIKRILDEINPFVQTFRQLARRHDINDCKLIIKERPARHNQYTLPSASQVAAIIVGAKKWMQLLLGILLFKQQEVSD